AQLINPNVNLTKGYESWNASVNSGSYKLYLMDKTSYNYTFSDLFNVSNNDPIWEIYYFPNTFADVSFDVPINVSMGSYLAITWSYRDSNVDLTKKSLPWAVTVDAG
ncbi:6741_t:CDS:2, partial [Racocetra persica]